MSSYLPSKGDAAHWLCEWHPLKAANSGDPVLVPVVITDVYALGNTGVIYEMTVQGDSVIVDGLVLTQRGPAGITRREENP